MIKRLQGWAKHPFNPPGILTTPDGVTYRPLTRTTLERALSPEGRGHLDFAVTFPPQLKPTRATMRIRATQTRQFHDLTPNNTADLLTAAAASVAIRPGDRVLLFGAGTGSLTNAIANLVGPSGAVTAFEADPQSVAYARARYPLDNAAHERFGKNALPAEPTAAAETIILAPTAPNLDPLDLWTRIALPGRILLLGKHKELADALALLQTTKVEFLKISTPNEPDPAESAAILVSKLPNA